MTATPVHTISPTTTWSFGYEGIKLSKKTVKIAKLARPCIKTFGKAMAGLGLFAGINAAVQLSEMPGKAAAIQKEYGLKDYLNSCISGIELLLIPTDAFTDVITFTEAISQIGELPAVKAFSVIALPVAFSLLAVSSAIKLYRIAESAFFLNKTNDQERFLQDYLSAETKGNQPTTAKENQLCKKVGKKVFKQLVQLNRYAGADKATRADSVFQNVKTRIWRAIALDTASLLTKVINTIAICLLFTPLSPFVAASLAIVVSLVKIGTLIYREYYLEEGLESPFT